MEVVTKTASIRFCCSVNHPLVKHTEYEITKLQSKRSLPVELLLLADETWDAIKKYIYDSEVYLLKLKEWPQPIAVTALYKMSDDQIEIKNIAVLESLQGKGIGSYLMNEIKRIAMNNRYKSIIVGTPDTSSTLIRFYEKNGFIKYAVRKNFFIKNYSNPIKENGVILRNMVMLKLDV